MRKLYLFLCHLQKVPSIDMRPFYNVVKDKTGDDMKKWIKMVLVMMSILMLMPMSILADSSVVQNVEEAFQNLPTASQYKVAKDASISAGSGENYLAYKQQVKAVVDDYLSLTDEERLELSEIAQGALLVMAKVNEIQDSKTIDANYQNSQNYEAYQLAIQQAKEKCNEARSLYDSVKKEVQEKVVNICEVDSYQLISDPLRKEEVLISVANEDPYVFKHSSNNRFYRYSIFDDRPLFTLVDTSKYGSAQGKSWTPSGIYSTDQKANFMAVYCVDIDTYSQKGTYYKRVNLEESGYFDEEAAAHIRSIVMNSYPFVSVTRAREILDGLDGKQDGLITNRCFDRTTNSFTGETFDVKVDQIDEDELITATQHAIWSYSNYFDTQKKTLKIEAYRLHQVTQSRKKESTIYPTMGLNYEEKDYPSNSKDVKVQAMSAVSQYLCDYLRPVYSKEKDNEAQKAQIIITNVEVERAVAVNKENDYFNVYLKISLQDKLGNLASGSENDDIQLTIYSYDKSGQLLEKGVVSHKVKAQAEHWINVDAVSGGKIKVVCEGLQELPLGAYFYSAKPTALENDEDVINPGRKEAQNFVGVAMGKTKVSAETEFVYQQEPEVTSLTLRKVGEQGERLKDAEFTLSLIQDGELPLKIESKTVSANGECTFENLVVQNQYEITETNPPIGYEPMTPLRFEVVKQGDELVFIFQRDVIFKENTLVISNQKYTELKVVKQWENDEYRLEYRPTSLEVELYKNNQPTGDVQVLNEANNWTYTWNKLSKKDSWSVKEKPIENYVSSMKIEGTVVTFINTLTLDLKTDLDIFKTDEKGQSLSGVEFSLYRLEKNQSELIETKITSNEGKVSFNDLSLGDYFLVEKELNGYQKMNDLYFSVVDNGKEAIIQFKEKQILIDKVLQIKNTKLPEKTSLTVIKKWNCQGNKIPDFIYVQLYDGNTAIENQKVKLSAENNWTYTFTDLEKGKNWTVKEVEVPQYYVASVVTKDGVVTITNSYRVDTGDHQPIILFSCTGGVSCLLMGYLYFRKMKHKGE